MTYPLLEIIQATKVYRTGFLGKKTEVVALQDFNLTLPQEPATITAIAGESGSGKTTLANIVLGFVPLTSGQVRYKGQNLALLDHRQRLVYRREVQAVFQDPYEVYNPFYRVRHVFDMAVRHLRLASSRSETTEMIEDALRVVGLRGSEVLDKYPHQLSGGQRQRIMIARAYMLRPRLIVADEPVSAVDASLRASILDAMMRLRDEAGISFLYITHDLSTAYQIANDIYVLYQGDVVEAGPVGAVIENPLHPYVQLLIDSVPVPDPDARWGTAIAIGTEESMRASSATGCRFYPRCPRRMGRCLMERPPLAPVEDGCHQVACFLYSVPAP